MSNNTEKLREMWDRWPSLHRLYGNDFQTFVKAQEKIEQKAFGALGGVRAKADTTIKPAAEETAMSMSNQTTNASDLILKAEWDRSPSLRAEFADSFEAFKAFKTDMPGVKVRQATGKGCTKEKFEVSMGRN